MPEGERPEPSGSHNWNTESGLDAAKRMRAEQAREQADVIQQFRRSSIESHIANLRQQANTPLYDLAAAPGVEWEKQELANAKHKLRHEQQAGVYTYMKDTYKARTIGDVEDKLRGQQHLRQADNVHDFLAGLDVDKEDM